MKTVAFIPLRGGSKSIPLKNIQLIANKPLAQWVIEAALDCKEIDEVFVATDSEKIKSSLEHLTNPKLKFITRSAESATDTATTEFALLEFLEKHDCEDVILIQATSPLLSSSDLEKGLSKYRSGYYDSLLSVVRQKRLLWKETSEGAIPLNYKPQNRPRRQEQEGFLVENGAFYISSAHAIKKNACRLSGKIALLEMGEESYIELDEPNDWIVAEQLLYKKERQKKKLSIKYVFTDVDGVLTDAGMYYSESGDELKKFNTRDGMGFGLLNKAKIQTGILTSEKTDIVERRGKKLGIHYIFQGIKNKKEFLQNFCKENNLSLCEIAYIGDDINDTELLREVGFSACPADAINENKLIADFICSRKGGEGCFRELVDHLLSKI